MDSDERRPEKDSYANFANYHEWNAGGSVEATRASSLLARALKAGRLPDVPVNLRSSGSICG